MSRGRGRGGVSKSFNREQLSAMGIAGNEMLPGLVTQPPPLYPLLERHPVPLNPNSETEYLLILRQDFIDHMQLSGSYLKIPETKSNKPEHEIDKLVAQLPAVKEKYNWSLFPSELRPKVLAKRTKKVVKEINIEEQLTRLEKLEEKPEGTETTKKEEEEAVDDPEDVEEEQDEEMDEGTDYANNYFDNGEDYEEEDDNLDDGPIY